MSLQQRQNDMRRRCEVERARRDEVNQTDMSATVCGHSADIATTETQARPRPTKIASDVQTAAPSVRLFDLKTAAAYLGVSYWTVRDLVLNGVVPAVRIPCPRSRDGRNIRRILIDRHDLDAFIDRNKEIEL
jgi:excisionase family DNA binding protein